MAKSKKTEKESMLEKAEDKIAAVVKEVVAEVKELASEEENEKKAKKSKESKSEESDKKDKLAKIKAKAEKLAGNIEEKKEGSLKDKVKKDGEEKDTLVPMEDYLKSSIHLGTRVITPDMRKFVYRRRADGLAVFNTALLDDLIREGADYLSQFPADRILLVCKRESGWKAANKFAEIVGVKIFTKKYPAGILTNTTLDNFFETDLVFICDPWLDKNALEDAGRIRIPVLSICDTNNFTRGVTKIVSGNNKSAKSLGMILYLLAKLYVEKNGIKTPEFTIKDFVDGWDEAQAPQ